MAFFVVSLGTFADAFSLFYTQVSYEGTRTAVKRIGIPELDGGSYRPWFYNQTAATIDFLVEKAPLFGPNLLVQELGPQFGGEIVNYEEGLAFLTVHGT